MRIIETIRDLFLLAAVAASPLAWAHPYGHHPEGDVVLVPHSHAGSLGSWPLALAFLLAGVAMNWVGRRLGGRMGRAVKFAGLGLAAGGTLLLFA